MKPEIVPDNYRSRLKSLWRLSRPAWLQAVAVVNRMPEPQPNADNIEERKLKVDKPAGRTYMSTVDICLLSFGYRASDTAP